MCEGKVGLIKGDMARDDDLIRGKVETAIAFVVSRVTQEDAHDRTGSEFVCDGGRKVRVALATKDTKMVIHRGRAEQGCVWRRHIECLGGEDVQKVGRRMECLDPKGWGTGRLKQKRADDIVCGTNDALSFTVSGGGVGVGHVQVNTMGQEEGAGARVVELFAVVALDGLDGGVKLGAHISKETGQCGTRVRLEA